MRASRGRVSQPGRRASGHGSEVKPKQEESLLDTVKSLAWVIALVLVVRALLFEPFNIPSGSLIPTILVGDYVFVWKLGYGYSKYSFPW